MASRFSFSYSKKFRGSTQRRDCSPVRCQPYLIRVEDSNVAKGPDVRESWCGAPSCSGRCEEE
ncbi:hypothetical protein BELL_0774g00020 [Botrytis elliptica]|uniref:Uncharacterized protein n=1 Tax=Botrytis elliptica TaxID=278938 RepID=A0A4Z1J7A5_9HELO|nr:hypothetical protein EAE99_006419 [Botrytis elliptica]TGO69448.1 hypothetical protein BELL_0774g00020 [Botrytis elliptica]